MATNKSVALVTGAGSGIGRQTAIALAEAGHYVISTDIRNAEATAATITQAGHGASGHVLDVRSTEAWRQLVAQVCEQHGGIEVLAAVAGVVNADVDTVLEQDEDNWQRVIDVDLKGVWLGMRAVLPQMIARGSGRIINVASLAGIIGLPNLSAYSAAKAGVIGLSRQAAMQYASHGITINTICPGIIETPILSDVPAPLRAQFIAATPLGRLGQPQDIAATVVHLASPGAAFITGQTLAIDGGWSAQ